MVATTNERGGKLPNQVPSARSRVLNIVWYMAISPIPIHYPYHDLEPWLEARRSDDRYNTPSIPYCRSLLGVLTFKETCNDCTYIQIYWHHFLHCPYILISTYFFVLKRYILPTYSPLWGILSENHWISISNFRKGPTFWNIPNRKNGLTIRNGGSKS